MNPRDDITALLQAWSQGNDAARDELMPIVYGELRRRAAAYLRHERPGHTLQATALVHEAYLRLVDQKRAGWINRAQFFGIASQMMRRILVDHARAGKMAKRSGQWSRLTLDEDIAGFTERNLDILDLDRALTRLSEFDPGNVGWPRCASSRDCRWSRSAIHSIFRLPQSSATGPQRARGFMRNSRGR